MPATIESTISAPTICLANVRREEVNWLWPGYIPRGMLSLIDGNPDLGKSFIALDLAARITRGWAMPPEAGASGVATPADVLILNAEDDPSRTIRPRLEALGANLARVHLMTGKQDMPVAFPGHLLLFEQTIIELQAALVVIDPLMAFLGDQVNSNSDQDIRRVLASVKKIAEQTQAAILVVRHLNKDSKINEAMYRGGGSIGIIGAARSALLVAKHPMTPCLRVLARIKGNLCDEPPALAYAIEKTDDGPVIAWIGELDMTANDLLTKNAPAKPRAQALAEAEQFICHELANGPMPSADLLDSAAKKGINEKTLRRAKDKLGVQAKHLPDMGAGWYWRLPGISSPSDSCLPPICPSSQEPRKKHEDGQQADLSALAKSTK